jgi:hypothetical protein
MPLVSIGSCCWLLPGGGGGEEGSDGNVIGGSGRPVSGTCGVVVLIGADGALPVTDVGLWPEELGDWVGVLDPGTVRCTTGPVLALGACTWPVPV